MSPEPLSAMTRATSPPPRAAQVAGDLLGIVGIVLCIPFVILAVILPIGLALRFLAWIAGMF